jgi:hypothetical protein
MDAETVVNVRAEVSRLRERIDRIERRRLDITTHNFLTIA